MAPTLTPPVVPHHEMVRSIGRGSYGEIWLARSLTGAWRAVKIVDRARFDDERSFEREFDGMARFEPVSREHEGFVDILHVGRSDDGAFFYYVMELADDAVQRPKFDPAAYQPKTLKSELSRVSRLAADEVVSIGLSLSTALATLHRHELVHRDIKPANIIFVGGVPKIADIGLVCSTGQNSFVGTEGYVPPEGPGGRQADIYSLGKVLYEIAMGKDRLDFPAVNTNIAELPDRAVLMRLNEVLLRACNHDTRVRYTSADEMGDDLGRVRDGRPLVGPRHRHRALLVVLLLLMGTGASAWWKLRAPAAAGADGAVSIETDPPGAMVIMNERMLRTPARFSPVTAGEHKARVMMPGYDPIVLPVRVTAGGDVKLPLLTMQRSSGIARVESEPAGCEFEIRRSDEVLKKGMTPAEFKDLPTGAYEVVMRHEGNEKRAPLEVTHDDAALVSLRFGTVRFLVTSTPQGAEIFSGERKVGTAPCEISLGEGGHNLIARYRNWPPQQRAIVAEPGADAGIAFAFPTGTVKITSAPAGATVLAAGRELGRTPLLVEDLEPGDIRYVLKLAGYEDVEAPVSVKPGEQAFVGASFKRGLTPRRGEPWENSLGMRFVPVGDVLVSIWATRVRDYQAFCQASGRARLPVDFKQDELHPVVRVNWEDARAFCEWLTGRERESGRLEEGQSYRLPTDTEWSAAAGVPDEGGTTPEQRDGRVREFPWGKSWPPPAGFGNYADASQKRPLLIAGYNDGFPQTSPVGSFQPNKAGLFDMSGNVWQWVGDSYHGVSQRKDWGVLRGGSWGTSQQNELRLGYRDVVDRTERDVIFGFRCVLAPGSDR